MHRQRLGTLNEAFQSAFASPPHQGEIAQSVLELATVMGYGIRSTEDPYGEVGTPGNMDQGDYMIVAYVQFPEGHDLAGELYPYMVVLRCDGPQGSLGTVEVTPLQLGCDDRSVEELGTFGLWPVLT